MPSFPPNPPLRSGLDAQLNFLTDLTRRSCDSMRKLSELNLQFVQQMMQDAADSSRNMLNCTDVCALAAAAAQARQPLSEHLRHYQQQLLHILSGVQLELTRSAEALVPEASRYTAAMAESMLRDTAQAGAAFAGAARDAAQGPDGHGGHGGNGTRYTPRQPQG